MQFHVKSAQFEDAQFIAPLFDAYRVFYKQESNIVLAHEFISERLKNKEAVIFCAVTDTNHFIGFVQLYPTFSSVSAKRSWVLNDLYVSSDYRRYGIAKALMEEAHKLALETGANGIALETAPDNEKAKALYKASGYQLENSYLRYFLSL